MGLVGALAMYSEECVSSLASLCHDLDTSDDEETERWREALRRQVEEVSRVVQEW